MRIRSLLAASALGLAAAIAACGGHPEHADLVLTGGTIHTLDETTPEAEAVAVKSGTIVALGDETDIVTWIGEGTRVVELDGAHVYPGFTDSHVHLRGIGERELAFNLEGVSGIEDLQDRIRVEAGKREAGDWIIGRGWIETHWSPRRFPTRHDLDAVAPRNPVALTRADGHALVANSAALALAGIGAETEAPFGGEILRGPEGQPSGMLIDNAMELLADVMPESTIEPSRALGVAAERSAQLGWTSVQIAGNDWQEAMLIRELVAGGEIPVRIYDAIRGPSESAGRLLENGPIIGASEGRFTLRGIKVSVDGALGSRGAALLEPYADADTRGLLTWTEDDLRPLYEAALREGIQVQTHAIGDRANRFVLDLYEQAMRSVPASERAIAEPRWRIEHAQVLAREDIPRFAEMDIIPSMQPSHAIGDLHFAPARLGDERLAGAYAWRKLLDTGVIIPAGSDAPVEQGDPRIEYYAMVTRSDLSGFQGQDWQPREVFTREEALRALTLWPAIAAFEEDRRGTISIGKYADFTVLDSNLLTMEADRIPDSRILMTIVGGDIVFRQKH